MRVRKRSAGLVRKARAKSRPRAGAGNRKVVATAKPSNATRSRAATERVIAFQWQGEQLPDWPNWLKTYTAGGWSAMIDRSEPCIRLRVYDGTKFQRAFLGEWISLESGCVVVYNNAQFMQRYKRRKIWRE